jgi:hypothetical protein
MEIEMNEINIPYNNPDKLPVGFSNPKLESGESYMQRNKETISQLKDKGINVLPDKDLFEIKRTYFIIAIIIAVGLVAIAGAIFYLGYYDKIKSDFYCGNTTLSCEQQVCTNTCPADSCDLSCPECGDCNCEFPDTIILNITYGNST